MTLSGFIISHIHLIYPYSNDLNSVVSWSQAWDLEFSSSKSIYLKLKLKSIYVVLTISQDQ